jgi:hypothetical protein
MYNINFIPGWYREKRIYRSDMRLKALSSILSIAIIALIVLLLYRYEILKSVNRNISLKEKDSRNMLSTAAPAKILKLFAFENYISVSIYNDETVKFISLEVTEKDILIEGETLTERNYIDFIKSIERDNKFFIKHLSLPEIKGERLYFKIALGR